MIFENKIFNNNAILDLSRVQINADAENSQDAVRKSQAEAIAATAFQAGLVAASANASTDSAFTSQYVQAALDGKQPNLSVDNNYFTLVNNTLGFKDLGIVKPYKDTTHTTMSDFIASATFNNDGTLTIDGEVLDKMTFVFLDAATNPVERSFVYLGTNNGNADDFVTFSVDYNQGAIRSFFSGTGVGINYTTGTGAFSLDFGTGATQLGAQSVPVDASEFSVVTGNTVLAIMKALETRIEAVSSAQTGSVSTLESRVDALSGTTANHMGTFSNGLIADNLNIKQVVQALETLVASANSDRTAIRSEFAAADTTLQSNIDTEATSRANADTTLQNNIDNVNTTLTVALGNTNNNLAAEAIARAAEDSNLDARLDVLEGTGAGSVAKAQVDAGLYTDAREAIIMSHVNANAADITKLTDSNIHLVATVGSNGLFDAVETDSRDGSNFVDVAMSAGEVVVFSDTVTLLGNGFKTNDKLMARVDIGAGNIALDKFVYTRADDTDLTKANIGSATINLDGSDNLEVTANSIGRTQLDASIESDVDDKLSMTSDSQTMTGKALKIEQSDTDLGSTYGLYLKRTQSGSGALTGTSRALLVENWIESNGSGNPSLPSYAHNTITSHYDGSCVDMSLVLSGAYCEANAKSDTAINAIGSYSVSIDTQLGVNIGSFAMAENAAVSNIAMLGYASTDGSGADRGVVGSITSQSLALYNATRVADPFPHNEIAVVADAKYAPAGSKAVYAYGDSIFEGGTLTVPSATTDTCAVNMGDLKGKQDIVTFDLSSGSKTITTSLDLSKVPPVGDKDLEHGVTGVSVTVTKDVANSQLTFAATGSNVSNLTSVTVYLQEYLVAARSA